MTIPIAFANPSFLYNTDRRVRKVSPQYSPKMVAPATQKLHVHTPLIPSDTLSALCDNPIYLKLDNLQPSGSFKIRGHGHLCTTAASSGVRHFISSSGGNAGAAVAYAGQKLGVKVTIVVPSTTPSFMLDRLRAAGANVIIHGNVWDDADRHARSLVDDEPVGKAIHISPFDHPLLWSGHSSLVDEIFADLQGEKLAAIVVSVGGGGLFLGIAEGLRQAGWDDVPIIAAETAGADSFAAMVRAGGRVVQLPEISSLAKSLGALAVSERCAEWVREGRRIVPVVVSDREAVEACSLLAVRHRVLVEPACGAAVAAVLKRPDVGKGAVVVIVCGGNMASPALLQKWIAETGAREVPL